MATYAQGQTIDVTWCVNADHGGVYSYRLCDDPDIVKKFYEATPLTKAEQLAAEQCFQEGILRCDDVDGNDCGLEPRCQADWGCAADPGKYFHCQGDYGGYSCKNTGESCQGGSVVRRKVKIPSDFNPGQTILSWRWDSDETTEVFAACADISIVTATNLNSTGPAPAPAPAPPAPAPPAPAPPAPAPPAPAPPAPAPPAPAPEPAPAPAPEPAPAPATSEDDPVCCWWSPASDMCSDCQSFAGPNTWCGESKERCDVCTGTWCANGPKGGSTDYTPPPPPPPVTGICCWWGPNAGDFCADCHSFAKDPDYCSLSKEHCNSCGGGGVWCE